MSLNLADLANCARCPKLVESRRRVVGAFGPAPAGVLCVGEAPGYWGADRTGIPFHGDKSGKRLQKLLIRVGLSDGYDPDSGQPLLRDCALTNVVRCHPAPPDKIQGNRAPARVEIANCADWLDAEIAVWRPRIIVPIGGPALRACLQRFLPDESRAITALHAVPLKLSTDTPAWLLPMRHPSRGSDLEFETWLTSGRMLLST